ncbi:MAG TPA: TonB family protein, partial [Balneolaceae bacterium]|nr:TonB family protein [Balneolaceae bacterium]
EQPHFANVYWDSARIVIDEFSTMFINAPQYPKIAKLKKIVGLSPSYQIPTCESLGLKLKVESGMDEFLSKVEYPPGLKNKSLSGSISYSFVVNANGKIESFQLASRRTSLGIEEAFEAVFDQLQFRPLAVENPPAKIRCEVEFPIRK